VGGIAKLWGDLYLLCLRLSGQAAGLPTGFRQKTIVGYIFPES